MMKKNSELWQRFSRGIAVGIPEAPEALRTLNSAKTPLRVKHGIDPTTPDLHFGHLVVFRKLRMLQEMGHHVVLLIGDFTARFGDPTEKTETRKLRFAGEVNEAAQALEQQLGRVLDLEKTEVRRNSEWYDHMSAEQLLSLMSETTAAQMMEREMFAKRRRAEQAIGLHELVYPILQGYDSVMLKADCTIVGKDQLFNENVGRMLQERNNQRPQVILGTALLPGFDGQEKMSQSLGNAIRITESPDEQFGKLMRVPDSALLQYAELLTDCDLEEVKQASGRGSTTMRDMKMRIAEIIVGEFHGRDEARAAARRFVERFREGKPPETLKEYSVSGGTATMSALLKEAGLVASRAEAQRLIQQKGVSRDGELVRDDAYDAKTIPEGGIVVAVGKRIVVRIQRKKKE